MHSSPWYQAVHDCQMALTPYVLVTLLGAKGSTPRDSGAKMVVTVNHNIDTVGGGELEHLVILEARKLLEQKQSLQQIMHLPLGALGQCCGGSITVMMEVFCFDSAQLWLFGAGHVGKALVNILQGLELKVHWVDSREQEFPQTLPCHVEKHLLYEPLALMKDMGRHDHVVIVTHDHSLDYKLCQRLLMLKHQGFIGLIGSCTKAERFRLRLKEAGFSEEEIAKIHCPVGLMRKNSKKPMEVAVSIAAQLLSLPNDSHDKQSAPLTWQALKKELKDYATINNNRMKLERQYG